MVKEVIKEGFSESVKKHWNIFSFLFKTILLLILGFLPSFVYVALFVQYGSILSNYINFLSNFESSIGAWASAGVIVLLGYLIFWIIKSRSSFNKGLKNKFILIILVLSVFSILFLVSVQLYLYINYTLGSDVLVKLSADKDNLFFIDNAQEEINFKISVVTNPFCSSQCIYSFFDINTGDYIEKGSFNLTAVLPKTKTYAFENEHLTPGSQILRNFEVSCKSKRTILCYTKGEETKRSILITLNYKLSDENIAFKDYSEQKIYSFFSNYSYVLNKLNQSEENIRLINSFFSDELFVQQLDNLSLKIRGINSTIYNLKDLWEAQNFDSLRTKISVMDSNFEIISKDTGNLVSGINNDTALYNNLINNFTSLKNTLTTITLMKVAPTLCNELNNTIVKFNDAVQDFDNLAEKSIILQDLDLEVSLLYNKALTISDSSLCITNNIAMKNLKDIFLVPNSNFNSSISLKEPDSICCYFGNCTKCCDDLCSNKNYPVIFLHGHSANRALQADYSLDTFVEIKEKLVFNNYIDAGAFLLSAVTEEPGLLGKSNMPIIVTASYFFDTYKTDLGEQTVSSNTDSIDTYAIRLKSIVDLLKYRTGKDKVIIVAHSMGGLVTRRYIQIFGGNNVDKIFLITVPNHGVSDKIKDYCAVFGQEVACNEMNQNSIFINKLNNAPTDKVPATNIIGIGCNMGDDTGDGIVKNSSQYLDYAETHYVKGSCNELAFTFLHQEILKPDKYPEIYDLLKTFLKI